MNQTERNIYTIGFLICIVVFLFFSGYMIGAYIKHSEWKTFYDLREKQINATCTCETGPTPLHFNFGDPKSG